MRRLAGAEGSRGWAGRARATVAVLISVQLLMSSVPYAEADPRQRDSRCEKTAAESHGWGAADRADEFDNPAALANWWVYDSVGHDGNGRRTPGAVAVVDGALRITGDADGSSGGVAQRGGGQVYGRWEVCVKSPPGSPRYHSVALLWPDAGDWPVGGEVDFMEIRDPTRQSVEFNLHWGAEDQRQTGHVQIDATQWH